MAKKKRKDRQKAKRNRRIKAERHERRFEKPAVEPTFDAFPYDLVDVFPDDAEAWSSRDTINPDDLPWALSDFDDWEYEDLTADRQLAARHAFSRGLLDLVAFDGDDLDSWWPLYRVLAVNDPLYGAWELIFRLRMVQRIVPILGLEPTQELMDLMFKELERLCPDDPRGPVVERGILLDLSEPDTPLAVLAQVLDDGIETLREALGHDPLSMPPARFTDPRQQSLVRLQALRLQCDLLADQPESVSQTLGSEEPAHPALAAVARQARVLRGEPSQNVPFEVALCAGVAPVGELFALHGPSSLDGFVDDLFCPSPVPAALGARLSLRIWDRILAPWGGQGQVVRDIVEKVGRQPVPLSDEAVDSDDDEVWSYTGGGPDVSQSLFPWPEPLDDDRLAFFDGLPQARKPMAADKAYSLGKPPRPSTNKKGRRVVLNDLLRLSPDIPAEMVALCAADNIAAMLPWELFMENDILVLEEGGRTWYIQLIGQAGEQPGFVCHRGDAGLRSLTALMSVGGARQDLSPLAGTDALTLLFTDRQALAPRWYEILKQAGRRYRGDRQWPEWMDLRAGFMPGVPDVQQLTHTAVLVDSLLDMITAVQADPDDLEALIANRQAGQLRHRRWRDGAWTSSWQPGLPPARPPVPFHVDQVAAASRLSGAPTVPGDLHLVTVPMPAFANDPSGQVNPMPMVLALFDGTFVRDAVLLEELATLPAVIDQVASMLKLKGCPNRLIIKDAHLAAGLSVLNGLGGMAVISDPDSTVGLDFASGLLQRYLGDAGVL